MSYGLLGTSNTVHFGVKVPLLGAYAALVVNIGDIPGLLRHWSELQRSPLSQIGNLVKNYDFYLVKINVSRAFLNKFSCSAP